MSEELTVPVTVVSPRTGELITLDAPTDDLGAYLADVREHESLLREAKNLVTGELLRRFDANAHWTHVGAGLKLASPSPQPTVEYDELALREALLRLVDAGELTIEAVDRAIEPVISYQVHAAGIKALEKLGSHITEIVAAHRSESPKRRYVTVTRA